MVISIKRASTWQVVLAVFATSAIASLVTFTLTNNSNSFQRDLISAIEQQKLCAVSLDGTDGQDGKDGSDGQDGKDGSDGQDGKDGADGQDGKDGTDGQDGKDGADGQDGKAGTDGQDGKDGADGTCQIVIGPEGQIGAVGPIGPAGPTGPKGDTGGITGHHGSFYDTTTQPIIAVNTPQAMRLNNGTSGANWVSADQVSIVDDSRITFANPGVYDISFSAQMAKTAPGLDPVDMWLRYKGTDLEWTNTEFPVDAVTKRYVAAWNFMIKVTSPYDWVELMWSTPEKTMEILSVPPQSNPTRPGIPSLLVSVQQVQ